LYACRKKCGATLGAYTFSILRSCCHEPENGWTAGNIFFPDCRDFGEYHTVNKLFQALPAQNSEEPKEREEMEKNI